MTELGLNIVSIPVTDQSRALHFYTTTPGFTVLEDSLFERVPGEQARWVRLAPPSGGATITLVTWFPTMASSPASPAPAWTLTGESTGPRPIGTDSGRRASSSSSSSPPETTARFVRP